MTSALIVDDSRIFRHVVADALSKLHCQVAGSVFNGVKALEFLRQHRVDLMTLDLEMPDMDGIEVLKTLRDPSWCGC